MYQIRILSGELGITTYSMSQPLSLSLRQIITNMTKSIKRSVSQSVH